jgi:hypothetical protein
VWPVFRVLAVASTEFALVPRVPRRNNSLTRDSHFKVTVTELGLARSVIPFNPTLKLGFIPRQIRFSSA